MEVTCSVLCGGEMEVVTPFQRAGDRPPAPQLSFGIYGHKEGQQEAGTLECSQPQGQVRISCSADGTWVGTASSRTNGNSVV